MCHHLAERISQLDPELSPTCVARLCLLMLSEAKDLDELESEEGLRSAWKHASFRLEAATDQYAAVSQELEEMCDSGPIQFTPDQLWVLLRAVKVQSQILELYTDESVLA